MLVLLLIMVLILIVYVGRRTEKNRWLMREELQNEASVYEAELDKIRSDLVKKKAETNEIISNTGKILIGYCMSSKEEFSLVKKHVQSYGFLPVIVLDCTMQLEALTDLLTVIQGENCEIMLTGTPFSDDVLNTGDSVRELLLAYGFEDNISFLLRGTDDVPENLDKLYKRGYLGLARYDDSVTNGLTDRSIPYIAYNFVSNSNQLSGGLAQVIQNKSAMIMVFDLSSIKMGKLNKADMITALDDIQKQVNNEAMVYSSVAGALEEIRVRDDLSKVQKQEYEEYEAAQQQRIDELEEKIHDIYSRWKEN